MNYCDHCGSDKLRYEIPEGDTLPRYVCGGCDKIHYTNPNMVVGCLIEKEDKIMLCRRDIEPRRGFWNLPCGYLENDETVQQGALREVYEETGASVKLGPLLVVYNLPHANQVYLIFHAVMQEDYYHTTFETSEIAFYSWDEIPWDEIAFSSNSFTIRHYIDLRRAQKPMELAIGSYFKNKIR